MLRTKTRRSKNLEQDNNENIQTNHPSASTVNIFERKDLLFYINQNHCLYSGLVWMN